MKTRREAAWSLLLLGAAELYLAGSGLPTALAQAAGTAFWATEGKEAFGRLGVLQGLAMLLLVGSGRCCGSGPGGCSSFRLGCRRLWERAGRRLPGIFGC